MISQLCSLMKPRAFKKQRYSFLIDTCSLIYLKKTQLLHLFASLYPLYMTMDVWREFVQKETDRGISFIQLIHSHQARTNGDTSIKRFLKIYPHVGLLTDDGGLCKWALSQDLFFINSLRVPCFIRKKRPWLNKKMESALYELNNIGRYSDWVFQWAKKEFYEEK